MGRRRSRRPRLVRDAENTRARLRGVLRAEPLKFYQLSDADLSNPASTMTGVIGLESQLMESDVELSCPTCTCVLWVLWAEIVAQTSVRCPACRGLVRLIDHEGGVHNAAADIEAMIRKATEGLFG